MSDFDLDAALAQILNGDAPIVTAPPQPAPVTAPVTPPPGMFVDSAARAVEPLPPLVLPSFTTDEIAQTLDIRNYATMVRLKMRKWHARAKDKRGARTVATNEGADEAAFSVYKKLLAGADEKRAKVASIIDGARMRHYEMTLPWSTTGVDETGRRDGARALANTLYMDYISMMAQAKSDMRAAVDDLKRSLPDLIETAKKSLGSAFDPDQYPSPEELDDMFALDYDITPIPTSCDFKGLPDQQVAQLRERLDSQMRKCLENAMHDVWARLDGVVRHMAERLGDPKLAFHDTLVGNVRETVALGRHLNATGDAKLAALFDRAERELCVHEPEELRKNVAIRERVATEARELLRDMARHGGV